MGALSSTAPASRALFGSWPGLDDEYSGEAWAAEGARVGYLAQEPQLDPAKSVRENVMEGVAPQKAIFDRYNDGTGRWTIPTKTAERE